MYERMNLWQTNDRSVVTLLLAGPAAYLQTVPRNCIEPRSELCIARSV